MRIRGRRSSSHRREPTCNPGARTHLPEAACLTGTTEPSSEPGTTSLLNSVTSLVRRRCSTRGWIPRIPTSSSAACSRTTTVSSGVSRPHCDRKGRRLCARGCTTPCSRARFSLTDPRSNTSGLTVWAWTPGEEKCRNRLATASMPIPSSSVEPVAERAAGASRDPTAPWPSRPTRLEANVSACGRPATPKLAMIFKSIQRTSSRSTSAC